MYYEIPTTGYSTEDIKALKAAADYWNRVLGELGKDISLKPADQDHPADINVSNRLVQSTPGVFESLSTVLDGSGAIYMRNDQLQCESRLLQFSQSCSLLRTLLAHEFGHSIGHDHVSCGQDKSVMQTPIMVGTSEFYIGARQSPLSGDLCAMGKLYPPTPPVQP